MSNKRLLSLAETLLILIFAAVLMGSVFYPYPFKILGYKFLPPHLRIPTEIGIIIGLIIPLVIPIISDRINRIMEAHVED